MRKSIALFTSTIALTSSLISNEVAEPTLHVKGGAWQLFGFNEEIDLKETFNGENIKVVWTWDNHEDNVSTLPWKSYSTEYSMRVALTEGNYTIVDRIPPNQGFWIMSYEDVDVKVIPFNPIKVDGFQDFYTLQEGKQISGSIQISSKLNDELKVSIKNDYSDIFTVTSLGSDTFPTDTVDGVTYEFSIYGESVGSEGFVLDITDVSGDHNYTHQLNIGVQVDPVPAPDNNDTNTTN